MDSFVLGYIAHRMEQLGFKKYSMEPVFVYFLNNNNLPITIHAQNEYYFLVTRTVQPGMEIIADNNHFRAENLYSNGSTGVIQLENVNLQDFTGEIWISMNSFDLVALEFIRVIPE